MHVHLCECHCVVIREQCVGDDSFYMQIQGTNIKLLGLVAGTFAC